MRFLLVLAAFLALGATASAQTGLRGADTNGDGAITRAEALAAREGAFARMDADSNGYLTEAERAARQQGQSARAARIAERMETGFAEMDENGDGRVSRSEFMAAPMPLFDRADANGDDVLSAEEMAAARERMQALRARRQ